MTRMHSFETIPAATSPALICMYTDARPAAGGLVYEKQRPSTRITPSFQIL